MTLKLLAHELRTGGETPALSFLTKPEAQKEAKARGWNKSDVMRVLINRFQAGWIIVDDHLGVLCRDSQVRQLKGEYQEV